MVEIQNNYKATIARKALCFFSCALLASFTWTGAAQGSQPDSLQQTAYLKASNTDSGDLFGPSVAISGDTLVVGAPREGSNATGINGDEANNLANESGAVYVFTRSGTVWSQQAYLKASNTNGDDGFGGSVAISGDTLVVGAAAEGSNATGINGDQSDNSAFESGAVYVFTRNGTVWSQQAYLKASNTNGGDGFGGSVAISGDTLVVAANEEGSNATGIDGDQNDNSAGQAGAVYVFTRNGMTWSQQAYLKASNTGSGDFFGSSVTISGDTLVIGASDEQSNATGVNGDQSDNSLESGAAYVFIRSDTVWSQQAYLKASNTDGGDEFGWSVAISGNTLVVGAHWEASNATGIDGDQNDTSATNAGAVYVFTRSGTAWSQQAYLKASNTGFDDFFGASVVISGDTLVVGARGESSNATGINGDQSDNSADGAGAAYVFTRSGTVWSQQAYLKGSNTEGGFDVTFGGDNFGGSVAISGHTLVVGAVLEASNATGIDGDQSDNSAGNAGAVYVFTGLPVTEGFTINAGLNDAWFNPATAGQGFFIIVFPVIKAMFVAMFTFETELPDPSTMATLGWAGQRWFTAFGDYADNQAVLDIEITSGGVFDSSDPAVTQEADGTLIVEFADCSTGTITYDIPSIARQGVISIQRIADDNVLLCEALSSE